MPSGLPQPLILAESAAISWESLRIAAPLVLTLMGMAASAGFYWARRYFLQRLRLAERKAKDQEELAQHARTDARRFKAEAHKWHDALSAKAQEVAERDKDLAHLRQQNLKLEENRRYIFREGQKLHQKYLSLLSACEQRTQEAQALREVCEALVKAKNEATLRCQELQAERDEERAVRERVLRRMKQAVKLQGQLWNARSRQGRPRFRLLEERQTAIVSVLNLKGGVGKTTIAAHLARAFAARGYRVLLIDIDFQGSLTTSMLRLEQIKEASQHKQLLWDFFQQAAEDFRTRLEPYILPIHENACGGRIHLVGTTDKLAYAELSLTLRWRLDEQISDPRFLLRKALHRASLLRQYDLVLIDCPPLVTISCVNALAASDYVLIPTLLSRKSRERIPPLLRRVLLCPEFLKFVNPHLRVLGVVLNQTHQWKGLTQRELQHVTSLRRWCQDAMGGQELRFFAQHIARDRQVRECENEFQMLAPGSRLALAFDQIAQEIEEVLPRDCRRTPQNPPVPGAHPGTMRNVSENG